MLENEYTTRLREAVEGIVKAETRGFKAAIWAINRKINELEGKEDGALPKDSWTNEDEAVFKHDIFYLINNKAKALNVDAKYVRQTTKKLL